MKCHPGCHKDAMWPVEKRIAAKLLYLWDHWHVSAPEFSPEGGTFVSSVEVSMKGGEDVTIFYTTNGAVPTTSSLIYNGPFKLGTPGTTVIKAYCEKKDMGPSAVVSASYTVLEQASSPKITPDANGPFTSSVIVTLETATPGASIHYTSDGTTPSATWFLKYDGPLKLSKFGDTAIKAVSVKQGMAPSDVATKWFHVQALVKTPKFTPRKPGPYITSVTVTLSSATEGASIWYTSDGADPLLASFEYAGPIKIEQIGTTTIKAYAKNAGMTTSAVATKSYIVQKRVEDPTFNPPKGTFVESAIITLSCATPGGVIHYTVDGTAATASSPVYTAPIVLKNIGVNTVRAIATGVDMGTSGAVHAMYTVLDRVLAPTILPSSNGPFTQRVEVVIECATAGATIRYTLDGSAPTRESAKYDGPFTITTLGKTVVTAFATALNMGESAASSHMFSVQGQVELPVIEPRESGPYTSNVKVQISSSTPGATIHYTIDGKVPTSSSPVYGGPFVVTTIGTVTINAFAEEPGMAPSAVVSQKYDVLAKVATPVLTPSSGSFVSRVLVTLSSSTSGAQIHYTSDGSAPTAASPLYNVPFVVDKIAKTEIKAIGILSGMSDSDISSNFVNVIPQAPTPVITPSEGTFVSEAMVTITTEVPDGVIHYTIGGAAPTAASTLYGGPFKVTTGGTNIIKAIVVKSGLGDSQQASASIFIKAKLAPPKIDPNGGEFRKDDLHKGAQVYLTGPVGAKIVYTVDGSDPTDASKLYTNDPFVICSPGPHTVKAMAIQGGMANSDISSAVFVIKKKQCVETIFEKCPPPGEDGEPQDDDLSGCDY